MYRHPRAAVIAFAFAFAALSTLTVAACEALPEGDKTSVYYWSDVYLDLYEDKLVVGDLEPGPGALEEPRPVLLITGVTIAEAWFDPIVARLERDGFVPYVYEPPALLSGSLFRPPMTWPTWSRSCSKRPGATRSTSSPSARAGSSPVTISRAWEATRRSLGW